MARTRNISKSKEIEMDEIDEMDEDDSEEIPVVSSVGRKPMKQLNENKMFTALLMTGTTYEYMGMKFRRGVPREVSKKYLKKFQTNGWFQVSHV